MTVIEGCGDKPPTWLQLESVVDFDQAEAITNLSRETIRRWFPHLVIRLSPRRCGLKLRDALAIASGAAA